MAETRRTGDSCVVRVRALDASEIDDAQQIIQLAFGTFLGVPDPATFMADRHYARTRWVADRTAAFAATRDGTLVGTNFATAWGSIGFFGPLTVHPNAWNRGVAQQLLAPTMDWFAQHDTRHTGLFTFAQSAKHVSLYQKFSFWPRFLTAIMHCPVDPRRQAAPATRFSELRGTARAGALADCRVVCDAVYSGLDVTREIEAVAAQRLGDTLLLTQGDRLDGFAVCHCGAGSEAGADACYVKFGTVRPGRGAVARFEQLLSACNGLACARAFTTVSAGVSLGRHDAYQTMLRAGFRPQSQGVIMHRPNEPAYDHPDTFVIDDWR